MGITIVGSILSKAVGPLLLAILPVSVKNIDGEVFEGKLDGFSSSSLRLDVAGEVVEFPLEELDLMRPEAAEELMGPTFRVSLVSGSRIAAQDLALTDDQVMIEPKRQNQLSLPVKQVKAIRFRPASVETDAQWLGIIDRESRGDTLVIRRPGNRLDPQQGVVVSIEGGKVAFDLDGDIVNAPIDRLEGVIFGGTQPILEDAEIRVVDVYGSTWSVLNLEPSRGDQPLQMRLSGSVLHPLPLHQIRSIRFTGGMLMLVDEKPAETTVEPYLKTAVDDRLMESFFGPRRDGDADLLMFGGSSIQYRIQPGYELFAGAVRRHEQITHAGRVSVRIALDGKTVWEQSLLDGEPRGFELPLQEARRLVIEIDSEGDGDLGDKVRVSRPRFLK